MAIKKIMAAICLMGCPLIANAQDTNNSVPYSSTGAAPTTPAPASPNVYTVQPGVPLTPADAVLQLGRRVLDPAAIMHDMRRSMVADGDGQTAAPAGRTQWDDILDKIEANSKRDTLLTKENCSGNGAMSFFSSGPTKEALRRAICRKYNSGKLENITDYECHSMENGFYKCFVSTAGYPDLNFELRYTNDLWTVYSISSPVH